MKKTLRDEFAMIAIAGIWSRNPELPEYTPQKLAKSAYKIADAMLEARKR